jgi:hypothetical protein
MPPGDYQAAVTLAKSDAGIYLPPGATSFSLSPEEIKPVLIPVTRIVPKVESELKTLPGRAVAEVTPAPRPGAAAEVTTKPARAEAVLSSSD